MDIKEEESILTEFPNIKLSYETYIHKKVYNAHLILAIPDGIRHYAWFTTYNNNNVCWLLELSSTNKIVKVSSCITSFSDKLSYGTILYGTLFKYKQHSCFSIEDMFYYKGKNISNLKWFNKLNILKNIFTYEINQTSYNKSFVVFGLPVIHTNYYELLKQIQLIPYPINFIQYRRYGSVTNLKYIKNNNHPYTNTPKITNEIVFKVKADIQNDIYHLYTFNNGTTDNYYGIAYIPNYKISVLMNNLFRTIKENHNLDSLEESDDESEFENENADKFVFLEKAYNMVCAYNNKFKKWEPVKLSTKGNKIITSKEIYEIEKNKY